MTINRSALLATLRDAIPTHDTDAAIDTAALVHGWLADGAQTSPPREELEAICRQIDVRKRLSSEYGPAFAKRADESPSAPGVVAGAAAVLLASAQLLMDASVECGLALKYVNSALKALALDEHTPHAAALRAWAVELLDAHTERTTP